MWLNKPPSPRLHNNGEQNVSPEPGNWSRTLDYNLTITVSIHWLLRISSFHFCESTKYIFKFMYAVLFARRENYVSFFVPVVIRVQWDMIDKTTVWQQYCLCLTSYLTSLPAVSLRFLYQQRMNASYLVICVDAVWVALFPRREPASFVWESQIYLLTTFNFFYVLSN